MGDKEGKQVLMCSWGRKSEPVPHADTTDNASTEHAKDQTQVGGEKLGMM